MEGRVLLTLGRLCPFCRGSCIYQSRLRLVDIFFRVFLLSAVRCGECDHRFYRLRFHRALPRERRRFGVVEISKKISA